MRSIWVLPLASSAWLLTSCLGENVRVGDDFGLGAYDDAVLADSPVLYLKMGSTGSSELDLAGTHAATYKGASHPGTAVMPNGSAAARFDGSFQYLEVADAADLSVPPTGVLTIEAWMRPDVLEFPNDEGSGYVHWLGKGEASQQEYVARIYSFTNTESPSRPNRISGYAFNLTGSLGSGSYFQDAVTVSQWIHYALVINTVRTSAQYPTGYAAIYKDGVLRDTTALNQYNVVPKSGNAPLRIGTRDGASFFQGAIGKVAVYDYELSALQLLSHRAQMME